MFNRSHILTLPAAIFIAGMAMAQQTQPGPGSQVPTVADSHRVPDGRTARQYSWQSRRCPTGSADGTVQADKEFVKSVLESSAFEVQLGNLAQEKGSSDAVKELGKRMVEAHTETGQQLKQAAAALNIPVSAEPPRKAKKAVEKLSKLSGTDFDRAYTKMAADEQKQAVKQFEREAKTGKVSGMELRLQESARGAGTSETGGGIGERRDRNRVATKVTI